MSHAHLSHAEPSVPTTSLFRLSAAARLAGVGMIIAAIWLGVLWAWS
jgi:hypothetical protein